MPPSISIIMPVWNLEAYVGESIASIQAQTMTDWELIVIDDGSTDGTRARVQAMATLDPRIRLLTQPNRGVAAARNRGLEVAQGRYWVFLDGDDLWHREFLARALDPLEQQMADAFCCRLDYLQAGPSWRPLPMSLPSGVMEAETLIRHYLDGEATLLMGNLLLRATGAIRELRFTEGCRFGEDTEFNLRALTMIRSVIVTEEALFHYRLRPGSATNRPWDWQARLDSLCALERITQHLLRHDSPTLRGQLERVRRRQLFLRYRFLYTMVKKGAWRDTRRLMMEEDSWRAALRSVALSGDTLAHQCKARLLLAQNTTALRIIHGYSRLKAQLRDLLRGRPRPTTA